MRVPQELGTPHRLRLFNYWSLAGLPDPKTPGRQVGVGLEGATNTGARGGNRRVKETKRDGTGGGESERFIVPWKPGNSCRENPVEGRGRLVAELWAGHRARALDLDPRSTKRPRAAQGT